MSEEPENLDKLFSQLAGFASMSPLDAQSHEMHEMFLSLLRVGFSEKQALFIISMAVVSLDVGDDEEATITPSPDHPSNREDDRHSITGPEDEEEFESWDEEDSSE
jgi:hypothetical protein